MMINQQLMPQSQLVPMNQPASQWSSGIFDCDLNMGPFCMACFLPCVQYGTNMSILNKTGCLLPAGAYILLRSIHLHCILGALAREKIRARYNIKGDSCQDALLHYFCAPCVLSQEHREIVKREHTENVQQSMMAPHMPIPQQQIPQPVYLPNPMQQSVYFPMPQNDQSGQEWSSTKQNLSFMSQNGLTALQPTNFIVIPPHGGAQSLPPSNFIHLQQSDYMTGQKMDNQ